MICLALHWRISSLFASEYLTSSISCLQVARALKLSTKSHSFLRKSTDANPSRTTSHSVPSEVRTSQSTTSLSPRSNEPNHPEEDDVISDDEKPPKGSLYYFHRVMNWDHTPCADWRVVQPQLSLRGFFVIGDDIVLLRIIRLVVPRV